MRFNVLSDNPDHGLIAHALPRLIVRKYLVKGSVGQNILAAWVNRLGPLTAGLNRGSRAASDQACHRDQKWQCHFQHLV